jgi:hypothetical protein
MALILLIAKKSEARLRAGALIHSNTLTAGEAWLLKPVMRSTAIKSLFTTGLKGPSPCWGGLAFKVYLGPVRHFLTGQRIFTTGP